MVYFVDKKYTSSFCFVSCYCIVVDDVNKQIGDKGTYSSLVSTCNIAMVSYGQHL